MTAPMQFESATVPTPEAVVALTENVTQFLEEHGVDMRAVHHTSLVLSEVLTNLATHGGCCDRPARIVIAVEPGRVMGEITDSGPPFDPRSAPEPSLDVAIEDRPIGGLGLFLVRKLTSALEYTRRNDENSLTFAITRGGNRDPDRSGRETVT